MSGLGSTNKTEKLKKGLTVFGSVWTSLTNCKCINHLKLFRKVIRLGRSVIRGLLSFLIAVPAKCLNLNSTSCFKYQEYRQDAKMC